jgi:hypothetical protein
MEVYPSPGSVICMLHAQQNDERSAERAGIEEMTLSLFSTLAIGMSPAYLIPKPQEIDRQR